MDDQLKTMLRDKADEMRLSPDLPGTVRTRARRRRAGNVLLISLIAVSLGVGSYAAISTALDTEKAGLVPAESPDGSQDVVRVVTWIFPEHPQQVQDAVDQGQDQYWREPAEVGRAFAEQVLGWSRENTSASVRGEDPVTVVIANPELARANGLSSDIRITLEMERWLGDGIFFIRRATSDILTLTSPPEEIDISFGPDQPVLGFELAHEFSGDLSVVPEKSVIAVQLHSEKIAASEAPAAAHFQLQADGQIHVQGGHVFASAALRTSDGSILTYAAYPVVFRTAHEDRVIAPCEKGAPSAPRIDFETDEPFPGAVSDTVSQLLHAAHDRDWQAIEKLIPETGFTFSYGADSDPVAYWKDLEASGTPVLKILETLMCYQGSESEGIYLFPDVAEKAPAEWTEGEMTVLREIYSEEEIEQMRELDSYYGWRAGIEPDGTWIFFVAGD